VSSRRGKPGARGAKPRPTTRVRRAAAAPPAAPTTPAAPRLPRKAKGPTPRFFDDPGVDALFGIVAALTAELSVAFERIRTLEQLLEAQGVLRPGQVEAHAPDPAELQSRIAAQEALLDRVFQVLDRYTQGS
jgi:hypothetical protein